MEKNSVRWGRLDNTAKLFPAISGEHAVNVFRLWADLDSPIKPAPLQEAVNQALLDVPAFAVKMRRGVFWYYFEENFAHPIVRQESHTPCSRMEMRRNQGFLFRVSYYEKRISLEVFHALTDGNGALYFLQHILFYYLKITQPDASGWVKSTLLKPIAQEEMWEDGFAKSDVKDFPPTKESLIFAPKAYHLDGEMLPLGVQSVTDVTLSAGEVAALAKSQNATVAQYLAALLIHSILQERCCSSPPKEPVVVSMPVNLRNFFPSQTLRNFFMFVRIGIDVSHPLPSFEEILQQVGVQMKEKIHREAFLGRIRQQRHLEQIVPFRMVPRVIKDFFLRRSYRRAERTYTCTLTNMGRIQLPPEFSPYVLRIGTMLGASRSNILKVAVTSLGDVMTIAFNTTCREMDLPCCFVRHLTQQGIQTTVTCNEVPR